MRRSLLPLLLCACAPAIVTPAATTVAKTPTKHATVSLCRLTQERFDRGLTAGVAQLTSDTWAYTIGSVLIRHPAGLVVLDPAFSRDVEGDLATMPGLVQLLMGSAAGKTPLVTVMERAGVDPHDVRFALATHAHWDHVGALRDLPQAKVLLPRAELEWARTLDRAMAGGVLTHHLADVKERLFLFDYTGPARDGFDRSFDVFGDGSVVAVPLPGHTPGSAGFFVEGDDGHTWLFSGDTSWTRRGVEAPAHKNPLVPIDDDLEATARSLGLLHALVEHRSDVVVVPAHDASAFEQLPPCAR
jgi:glyoxylase-like metal-dependent hydrolase (beta-lactamase superfamily II)